MRTYLLLTPFLFILSINCLQSQDYTLEWVDSIQATDGAFGGNYNEIAIYEDYLYFALQRGDVAYDIVILKYHKDGNFIWERTYDESFVDFFRKIKIDNEGNPVLQTNNQKIVKYSEDGDLLWSYDYQPQEPGASHGVKDFVFDESNAIYFTGTKWTQVNEYENIISNVTFKLDENGDLLWEKEFSVESGWTMDLKNDHLNIFTATTGHGGILKCALNGDSISYSEFALDEFRASNCSIDQNGNFYGGAHFEAYTATKINQEGNKEWYYEYTPQPGEQALRSWQVEADTSGNVYVGGQIIAEDSYIDILISKLDINGNLLWEVKYNNFGDSLSAGIRDLKVMSDKIIVAGYVESEQGDPESLLLVIDSNGQIVFERTFNKNSSFFDAGYSVIEDEDGHIYFLGAGIQDGSIEGGFFDFYKFNPIITNTNKVPVENKISLQPNPCNEYLFINSDFENFEIFNLDGQKVKSKQCSNGDKNIDVSTLLPGMYFIRISENNQIWTEKFVKI